MSYILEALKKIEQKQQRDGRAPRLLADSDVMENPKRSLDRLPYLIAGALALNAAIMIFLWVAPWRPPDRALPGDKPLQRHETLETVAVPSVTEAPVFKKPAKEEPISKGVEKADLTPTRSAPDSYATSGRIAGQNTAPLVRPPVTQPRKEVKALSAPPRNTLIEADDLPADVRASLPEFKISGHAYNTEPRFRVARVNDKIVQEGEQIGQGLKVDEIVPGGVIFTYQGYRFKVGINNRQ